MNPVHPVFFGISLGSMVGPDITRQKVINNSTILPLLLGEVVRSDPLLQELQASLFLADSKQVTI